jgi:hypothetical protein
MSFRIRPYAFVAALCVTASLVPAAAGAQATDSSRRSGFHPRIAAGVDAMLYDGSQRVPSLYGVAGLEWLHPHAPFSARFDLTYFRRDRELPDRECGGYCVYASRYAVTGLAVDGRYTFRQRAAVRPYLVSGFGLYRSTQASITNFVCRDSTCTTSPDGRDTQRVTTTGLGLDAGFGFAFPIRRSELTLEFLFRQQAAGYRQGATMPITLGVRF